MLTVSDRFFVTEGSLKQLKLSGTVRTLYYYLLSDTIIFAVSSRVFQKNSKQCEAVVSLPGCWLSPSENTSGTCHTLVISIPSKIHTDKDKQFLLEFIAEGDVYQFMFEDKDSSESWRELMLKTIGELYQRRPDLISKL
mgnify:CR=1 FL=1